MHFKQFNFHPLIAAGVTAAGYDTPTPIQQQAIPPILSGRDVMGLAQTGTGKTAAFALPILHRLVDGPRGRIRALIVAPTRELAEQIHESINTLGRKTRIRSITIYGGVNINPQIQKLKQGVEIVVACPGRLLDHLSQGTIDLSHVEVLVLDEADQMFDMGFLPDIRRILKQIPEQRQNLLFSATMPADIRALANDILRDHATIQVGNTAPPVTVSHALYPVAQHLKTALLLQLLQHTDTESVLVFTRTKHRAKRVGEQLEKAGYKATSLQGNLSQNRRQAALDGFRDGTYQILVATDIAARGIDVSQISHVVNFDIPDTAEAYVHRIGRTGRAAKSGDAFTMVTNDDAAMVRAIEKALGTVLGRRTVEGFDYSVPAPHKDTEFARPPREPRQVRKPSGGAKKGNATAKTVKTAPAKANPAVSSQQAQPKPAVSGNKSGLRTPQRNKARQAGRHS
ncbi:DEAD/DEAH box helicase [Geobacter pelophilus]|uniref:DEAD-box ATP-dependent RNA helicase RhpA n=1 Tax=Geoanaerobacter pelophilus TaxID=60036 RepID=A0AAW4KZS0_9BACT|nr:DEAD/DEAH box helicase [Geoanaerobacter pelophilus]MBT0664171.1 DEAD/DEAH box helicase [Geoanaerobacter pelophilus]